MWSLTGVELLAKSVGTFSNVPGPSDWPVVEVGVDAPDDVEGGKFRVLNGKREAALPNVLLAALMARSPVRLEAELARLTAELNLESDLLCVWVGSTMSETCHESGGPRGNRVSMAPRRVSVISITIARHLASRFEISSGGHRIIAWPNSSDLLSASRASKLAGEDVPNLSHVFQTTSDAVSTCSIGSNLRGRFFITPKVLTMRWHVSYAKQKSSADDADLTMRPKVRICDRIS